MDSNKNNSNITSQIIEFKADDKEHCFELTEPYVKIIGSTGNHDHGSSKVKLKNVVDYKWEQKNYLGRLIAVHLDGVHIAYRITVNKQSMVRVAKVYHSGRALIKSIVSEILDLQFAHIEKDIILGCIEETNIHVYKIISDIDTLTCESLLQLIDPIPMYEPKYDKINWCPYVPENKDNIDEFASQLLVWVRGKQFQYFNVNTFIEKYNTSDNYTIIKEKLLRHNVNYNITAATFSPDGTTLAVSSEDGVVRFYQVYIHAESNPRCLHEWTPHDGKPISSLFFLDNHMQSGSNNSLWKHAITGTDNNTELKLWSCETWECTQTIKFESKISTELNFKVEIDKTSSYLVLNDMRNRGLYVLQIVKVNDTEQLNGNIKSVLDNSNASREEKADKKENGHDTQSENSDSIASSCVYVNSVAEFPLSSPILGFEIANAAIRRYKCGSNDNYLMDELEDFDEENSSFYCIVIKMYIVQPKSLQECNVLYQPRVDETTDIKSTLSESTSKIAEDLNMISLESESNNLAVKPMESVTPKTQPNLLTPNSFSSSGKKSPEAVSKDVMYTLFMLANATSPDTKKKSLETLNLNNIINNKVLEEKEKEKIRKSVEMGKTLSVSSIATNSSQFTQPQIPVETNNPPVESQILTASGGSSPSREVQEILSLKDTDYDDPDLMYNVKDEDDNFETIDYNEKTKDEESDNDINQNPVLQTTGWPDVPKVLDNLPSRLTPTQIQTQSKSIPVSNEQFNQLLEIIQNQSCQIEELRTQISELHKLSEGIIKTNSKIALSLPAVQSSIQQQGSHYEKEIQSIKIMQGKQMEEFQEHILSVMKKVINQLSIDFIGEINKRIVPLIADKMDGIKQQIQIDIKKKLLHSNEIIKESISQVCYSDTFMESFGSYVLVGVKSAIQPHYVDSLTNTLIPAYENCTKELFTQIRKTFMDGTAEFSKQFENYIAQFETPKLNGQEILELVQLLPRDIKKHNDQIVNAINIKLSQELGNIKDIEGKLLKSMKENIRKEIEKSFANQTQMLENSVLSAVRSQAPTPAPTVHEVQEQIKTLLTLNQINKAFHLALIANDLNLVEFVTEKADHRIVFNPCKLEQSVLLSLIQQITADMSRHNELKQRYLSEAILNLDFEDPITKEHAPKVMREMYQKCQDFLVSHPNSPISSEVKMLSMAVHGMSFRKS